jgi:hypothetical protein
VAFFIDQIWPHTSVSRVVVAIMQAVWILIWLLFSPSPAAILISGSLIISFGGIIDRAIGYMQMNRPPSFSALAVSFMVALYAIFLAILIYEIALAMYAFTLG